MINVSPIGRDCTADERKLFIDHDKKYNVLGRMQAHLQSKMKHLDLKVDLIVTYKFLIKAISD